MKLQISEPVIISMGPDSRTAGWGPYQFPDLFFLPDGRLMTNWSNHDFTKLPDKEKTLEFVRKLTKFYKEKASDFLYDGRMIEGVPFECNRIPVHLHYYNNHESSLPEIYSSAWEKNGRKVQIFVNHTDSDITLDIGGNMVLVKSLDAEMIELN